MNFKRGGREGKEHVWCTPSSKFTKYKHEIIPLRITLARSPRFPAKLAQREWLKGNPSAPPISFPSLDISVSLFFQRCFFSFLSFFFLLSFSFWASRLGIGARPSISIIKGGFDILPLPGAVKSIEESRTHSVTY